jgi:hypothetical protein
MSATLAPTRQAVPNPMILARKAINDPRPVAQILEGLNADKARIKYGCVKALRLISERRPEALYPHFDFFVRLLDHENKIFQWNAAFVLSHLTRVDRRDRFAPIFKKYFSPVAGPVMITAANVIQGGSRIAQAKPHWADRIAGEILKVAKARYQTAECRNVAISHAITALGEMLPLLRRPDPVVQFVRKQTRSPRPATRKKAERFLRSRLQPNVDLESA